MSNENSLVYIFTESVGFTFGDIPTQQQKVMLAFPKVCRHLTGTVLGKKSFLIFLYF